MWASSGVELQRLTSGLKPLANSNTRAARVIMRKSLKFILIIGIIGSIVYYFRTTEPSTGTQAGAQNRTDTTDTLTKADKLAPPTLGAPVPQPPAQKKTDNKTQVDSGQAALVNVMKAAIAARHGGVLPKTLTDEDAKAASQAAIKWQAKH
jgi:hypothetical protein